MAKNPATAFKLMTDLAPAVTSKARAEAAKIQKLIDAQGGGFQLQPWDWDFYSEQVRKAEYDLDESQVKPYFELEHVLQRRRLLRREQAVRPDVQGAQGPARVSSRRSRVRGLRRRTASRWPSTTLDLYARPNKSGGAWMDSFVDQSALLGTHPVVVQRHQLHQAGPGTAGAAVVRRREHALPRVRPRAARHVRRTSQYPTFTGTTVPRDFVRVPVAVQRALGARADRARQLRQALPDRRADAAGAGRQDQEVVDVQPRLRDDRVSGSRRCWTWPGTRCPPAARRRTSNAFEAAALKKYGVTVPQVPPRYHTTYFSHTWGGGYSAGYYAYLWSDVIDEDAWFWFKEHGGLTRENGKRFHDMVLSRGGSTGRRRDVPRLPRPRRHGGRAGGGEGVEVGRFTSRESRPSP